MHLVGNTHGGNVDEIVLGRNHARRGDDVLPPEIGMLLGPAWFWGRYRHLVAR
jgi:hypothetical protein